MGSLIYNCLSTKSVHAFVLFAFLSLSVPSVIRAQHDHGDESNSVYERFQKPQVKYLLQAELLPQEGLIRGWMDINWTNLSSDTIRSICLDFGFSPYDDTTRFDFYSVDYANGIKNRLTDGRENYCWLDSVLYQAARLDQPARMRGRSLLELPLPVPIYPGQAGPLSISFETRFKPIADSSASNSLWLPIPQWFPQVAHYVDGEWQSTADLEATDDRPMASFAISLSVDSSFHITGSGELMNEKEHFGTLPFPSGDTVNVDVTSFLFAFTPDIPYRPKFAGGKKSYHFRLLNGNNFPILLSKQFRMDRAQVDGQLIEIVYPPEAAAGWREKVGIEARIALIALSDKLGYYPYPILRIVALPEGEASLGPREMIFLSERISGNSDIRAALTVLMARSWLADFVASGDFGSTLEDFSAYDEALAEVLAEQVIGNSVTGWKSHGLSSVEPVKSRLNDLILVVGQEKFLTLVTRLSRAHQFRLVSEIEFMNILQKTCGDKGVELISQKPPGRSANPLNRHRMKTGDQ